jgi:WD40 repeat protein
VRFWDVRSFDAWVLRGHAAYVYPVLFSPDGATIYSGGWDGYVGQPGCLRFWDAATGDLVAATGAPDTYIRAAALSRDGSRLAILANTIKQPAPRTVGSINILDTATGRTTVSIALPSTNSLPPAFDSIAFDSAAQHVMWIDFRDGMAHMADAQTGVITKSRALPGVFGVSSRVALSPDGVTIAAGYSGADGGIYLLDPQSLEPLRRWPHHSGDIFSVAFSPDSRRLLTTSQDGTVRVWDVATGNLLHTLVGHANRVLCALYSPDGLRIASGGGDNSVRLWDANTFEQVGRLGGHEDYVYSLAWRPDSQQLVSSSGDHTLRIWDTLPLKDRVQARRERQAFLAQVTPTVEQLFTQLSDPDEVIKRLKADSSLSPRARQIALQVALQISLRRQDAASALPAL